MSVKTIASDDVDVRVVRYTEVVGSDEPNVSPGSLTERMRQVFPPLVPAAIRFESNLIQRDDVLIAMAARDGIYIPPVDYGDVRGYYNESDGQYVVREYGTRLVDIALRCASAGVSDSELMSWVRATPQEVATSLRELGIIIPPGEIDEENEYYQDRVSYYLRLRQITM
jgi:hypothetical protein